MTIQLMKDKNYDVNVGLPRSFSSAKLELTKGEAVPKNKLKIE